MPNFLLVSRSRVKKILESLTAKGKKLTREEMKASFVPRSSKVWKQVNEGRKIVVGNTTHVLIPNQSPFGKLLTNSPYKGNVEPLRGARREHPKRTRFKKPEEGAVELHLPGARNRGRRNWGLNELDTKRFREQDITEGRLPKVTRATRRTWANEDR